MTKPIRYERVGRTCPPDVFDQLARIHKEEIDQGFLSTFSMGFLRRLYRALADSPHAFLVAALHEDEVVGFICGSMDTGKVYRDYFLRWGLRSIPFLLPKLVSVRRVRRTLETLCYPARKDKNAFPSPEILNLCVASPWQRKGIGKRLFAELVYEFDRRGVERIKIISSATQHKAHKFYRSLNASKVGEIDIHAGLRSFVYVYDIAAARLPDRAAIPHSEG